MRPRLLPTLLCCAFLAALPAAAQPTLPDDNCSTVCTETTPCNQWCADRESNPWAIIFCEDYGVCDPSTVSTGGDLPSVEDAPADSLLLSPADAPVVSPAAPSGQGSECTSSHASR